jgi:hypothetical protein
VLPSAHARWSQDTVGGPAANTGSVFAPSPHNNMMRVAEAQQGPTLPSSPHLSAGGGQLPMASPLTQPQAPVPSVMARRMM